ncbi:MAG: isoprenylcysteine carboxylmethyltransferase family protein [Nodosilinea sp. WJT8-NPBG4]|jgi:protein-S-isoprenylcysteine O-methyltransferase Ste14|nr:isoprenylcysteine carboxylmethyltransferase family protein [Nodosilinea sp. WJT8-NPBG4]
MGKNRVSLELKVPPIAVVIVFAVVMAGVAKLLPGLSFGFTGRLEMAISLALAGVSIILAGILAFRQHRTTVNPFKPETATAIVTTGVYRFTRNPMYVGFVLILAGWAAFLVNLGAVLVWPICVVYLTQFQIKPEERTLLEKFGRPFTDYMARVRRWV